MQYVADIHIIMGIFRVNRFEMAISLEHNMLTKKYVDFRHFINR